MATQTQAADRHTTVTTGWTNPTNAYATTGDNVYATAAPAKNSTVNGDFGFPSLGLPAGATINAVRLVVEWGMTAAVTGGTLGVQGRNNNVADTAAEVTQTTTTEAQSTFTFGTKPSVTDLNTAGRVVARVRCTKGNSNTAMTGNLDFVRLEVDYSVTTAQSLSATATAVPAVSRGANLTRLTATTGNAVAVRSTQRILGAAVSVLTTAIKQVALILPQGLGGTTQVSWLSLLFYQDVGGGGAPGVAATGSASVVASRFYTKALSALASGTATRATILAASRVVLATASVAATLAKLVARGLTVTAASAASLLRDARRVLAVTATGIATAALLRVYLRALSAIATGTASATRAAARRFSTTATTTASAVRAAARSLATTATGTATVIRTTARNLTATSTAAAVLIRGAQKTLSAVASGIASVSTQVTSGAQTFYLALVAVATGTATTVRAASRTLTATGTGTGTARQLAARTVSVVANATATLATQFIQGAQTFYLALTAVVTGSATLARSGAKAVSADATAAALATRDIARSFVTQAQGTAGVLRARFLDLTASATGAAQIATQTFLHGAYRLLESAGHALGVGVRGVARMAREGVQHVRGTESRGSGRSKIGD